MPLTNFLTFKGQSNKSISAREFFRIFPRIKRKYFWGGKLWTQSFFVETVGKSVRS